MMNCFNCEHRLLSSKDEICRQCFDSAEDHPKWEPIKTHRYTPPPMPEIKPAKASETILDSGERRQFGEGAVRDMASKGRCDLLPWDVIAIFDNRIPVIGFCNEMAYATNHPGTFAAIRRALDNFIRLAYADQFATAMLEVAYHYEAGAKKYSDRNWQKGMPVNVFLDSAGRHFLKYLRGDTDEEHARAVVWNLLGALWMINNKPEWIDKEVSHAD